MTFGLPPPKNVNNLFGNWLVGIDERDVKNKGWCVRYYLGYMECTE
jgi:hypothetical protein